MTTYHFCYGCCSVVGGDAVVVVVVVVVVVAVVAVAADVVGCRGGVDGDNNKR